MFRVVLVLRTQCEWHCNCAREGY